MAGKENEAQISTVSLLLKANVMTVRRQQQASSQHLPPSCKHISDHRGGKH